MAFTNTNLVLQAHGNDHKVFSYVSTADTVATIRAVGYFNNTDDDVRMSANDIIIVVGSDNTARLKVASVSSGAVTTAADTGVAIFAATTNTSFAIPGEGVVTIAPTSAAQSTYRIAAFVPGSLLELINIGANTSAAVVFGGAAGSTSMGFGVLGENTLTLFVGGSVQLRALTTLTSAIVGQSGATTTSGGGKMTLTN